MESYSDFVIHFMSIFASFIFQGICLFHLLICYKICRLILDLLVPYYRSLRHYLLFCCTDVYIDSAKALARKTVGSLVQIKAVT